MTNAGQFVADTFQVSEHRRDVYEWLKLGFTDDGMPGKTLNGSVIPHPLYPTYVLIDLLRLWVLGGRRGKHLQAAQIVADAALSRMTDVDGALIYYYEPASGLSYHEHRYYSALTQARYLKPLADVARAANRPDLLDSATRICRALTIPSNEGGVMLDRPYGPVLEEYPHQQPLYVLNGWTSAAVAILEFAQRTDHKPTAEFGRASVDAMLAILAKFDVPELANSRYGLASYTWLRLKFSDTTGVRLLHGEVEVPDDGVFALTHDSDNRYRNWWQPTRVAPDGTITGPVAQANVLLSNINTENTFRVRFAVEQPTVVTFQVPEGHYNPLGSSMKITGWKDRETVELEPGEHYLTFVIPLAELPFVGYPTNFKKLIAGRYYNAYHYIHIRNMQNLLKMAPDPRMVDWLVRWTEYLSRWHEIAAYADERISLRHVPNGHEWASTTF